MKKTYFNHDSNSRNDIRIIKLRAKLSYEGYGIFWALLELLFNEENKLCISDYETLAFGLQCDPKILKQVIEDFDLFVIEDNCFYSKRLHRHIEDINNKSTKAKESINKRWNNTNVLRTKYDSNTSRVEVKVNKSISKRIECFRNNVNSLKDFSDKDKNDFIEYWSELTNEENPKMKWELSNTFNIEYRLKRWVASDFNKKDDAPSIYNKMLYGKNIQ